jgi:hypothetical protein
MSRSPAVKLPPVTGHRFKAAELLPDAIAACRKGPATSRRP